MYPPTKIPPQKILPNKFSLRSERGNQPPDRRCRLGCGRGYYGRTLKCRLRRPAQNAQARAAESWFFRETASGKLLKDVRKRLREADLPFAYVSPRPTQ